ncbi:uncharacterized protein LOC132266364 [Cornus florida]|uniref:uncharacterized protein LOC132266364 n=1 Tax=Cornus florida TaxID=4283 RepID=UPI00289A22BA|nr:uncharacterized protein LOC132266364 [Cornus florida]
MKFATPQPIRQALEQRDKTKHCAYHRDYGHTTNDYRSLRRQVENMILRGELADYLTIKEYMKPREVNPRKVEAHKLRRLSLVNVIASGSINIGFGDGDLSRVQLPHEDPLVINLLVANCIIKRVLVDLGSSANNITKAVFEQLEISSSSIRFTSNPLMGFDGTKVDPLGVIDLSATAAKRILKENFVLTEIHPSYNLIMGREDEAEAEKPTEESLEAVEIILGDPQRITYMGSSPIVEEKEALINEEDGELPIEQEEVQQTTQESQDRGYNQGRDPEFPPHINDLIARAIEAGIATALRNQL